MEAVSTEASSSQMTNLASTGSPCETELTHWAVLTDHCGLSQQLQVDVHAAMLGCFIGAGAQTQVLMSAQRRLLPTS